MKRTIFLWMWIMAGAISLSATGQEKDPGTFEKESRYDFETTVERIRDAASESGWSLPGDHDMQATLKKGGKDVLPSTIVVLCNGKYAYQLLSKDESRKVQTLLPCRVAVYEKTDGNIYVAWSNYEKKGREFGDEAHAVFQEVSDGLKKITQAVVK
ncbi:MAG: DUF302 domain-containing protein [Bacteroidota bacterium]